MSCGPWRRLPADIMSEYDSLIQNGTGYDIIHLCMHTNIMRNYIYTCRHTHIHTHTYIYIQKMHTHIHTKQSCKWGVLHIDRNIQQQGCRQHFRFLGSTTWTTHGFLIATCNPHPWEGKLRFRNWNIDVLCQPSYTPSVSPQKIGNMWEVCFASCPVMSTVSRFTTQYWHPCNVTKRRDHLSKSSTLLWDILCHVWGVTVFLVWASNYSNYSIINNHHDFGTSSPLSWKLFSGTQKMDEKPRFHHEFPQIPGVKIGQNDIFACFFHVTLEGSWGIQGISCSRATSLSSDVQGSSMAFPMRFGSRPSWARRPGSLGSLVKLIKNGH